MIELSLGGLIGAFAGTVVAALAYAPLVVAVQRRLSLRADEKIALIRRAMLTLDVLTFAGLGYWMGALVAG